MGAQVSDYTNVQLALTLAVGNDHPLRYESDIRDRLKAAEIYLTWLDEKDLERRPRLGGMKNKIPDDVVPEKVNHMGVG